MCRQIEFDQPKGISWESLPFDLDEELALPPELYISCPHRPSPDPALVERTGHKYFRPSGAYLPQGWVHYKAWVTCLASYSGTCPADIHVSVPDQLFIQLEEERPKLYSRTVWKKLNIPTHWQSFQQQNENAEAEIHQLHQLYYKGRPIFME